MSAHYENFGKYVLLEKLATGGMAEVFLARGNGAGGIGKFFAIKRILPQYAESPEFIDMFKDEAKIAINLSHSNIVSIHEFGIEKGTFFLVMDYVEGRNLRQILNKMKKSSLQFSMDQIVFVIKEIAAGLDHAHRCIDGSTGKPLNITHRDMSPQNCMVSFEGEVKIVDFGIAKAESQIETTRAGTLKGKFGYMSPEQAEGQPVDLRTDIFSLGIVLWELLANDRLFVANNEINTLRKIRDCQIPSLRKINPNIHTELERIVQKALARDRNLRYQTGAALHRDLNRFLNRQYPDFSPQDFSVFIKSVFADEILGLRKRLVEYAKVNLTPSLNLNKFKKEDDTALLSTNTNSMVESVEETRSQDDSTVKSDSMISLGGNVTSSLGIQEQTKTIPTDPQKTVIPDRNAPPVPSSAGVLNDSMLESSLITKHEPGKTKKIIPINRPMPRSEDEKPPRETPSGAIETEEVTSPLHHDRLGRGENSRTGIAIHTHKVPKTSFATLIVFLILMVSVYSYLCKFYPSAMAPAISGTYALVPWYYTAIGTPDPNSARVPSGEKVPPPVVETKRPWDQFSDPNSLNVTSVPSGAAIWINGLNTGKTTPQVITVPVNEPFTVVLRKKGYNEYKRENVTREAVGHKLDANLDKMYVGYLNIEIFPPQEANLYINGKQIRLNRTLASVMVPANRAIKVRAESRSDDTFDEITVQVPLDRAKSIKLNPRKMLKSSGTPAP